MENQTPELQVFTFSEKSQPLNTTIINGEPFFIAKDICDVLEFQNPTDIVKKFLDNDEYLTYKIDRAGQKRDMVFVNESGLYCLIFRSNKPAAKTFRKWVTSEVLPQIRKTGSYSTRNYKRTECYTGSGYVAKGFYKNYIDFKGGTFTITPFLDSQIKTLEYEGQQYYSIPNFLRALKNSTGAGQWATKLKTANIPVERFWLFGASTPAPFTTQAGLNQIKLAMRTIRYESWALELPFN